MTGYRSILAHPRELPLAWMLLAMPLIWIGLGKRYPFALFGEQWIPVGNLIWALVTGLWMFGALRAKALELNSSRVFFGLYLGSLLLIPIYDLVAWKQFAHFGYQFPTYLLVLDFCVLGYFLITRRLSFGLAAFTSIAHLVVSIFQFPAAVERSDMLPMIQKAAEFFIQGLTAYEARVTEAYRIPYPPLMWLGYLPSVAAGIDVRWWNVICRAALALLLYRNIRREDSIPLGFFSIWFLNPYLQFRHDLNLDPYWLLLTATFLLALGKRSVATALTAGLLCATLQWGWIFTPFALMLASRDRRELVSASVICVLITGSVFGVFFLREGPLFLEGLFQHFRLIGTEFFHTEQCLGLSGPFLILGWVTPLVWIQRVILLGGGIWALSLWSVTVDDLTRQRKILAVSIWTILLFIFFGPLIENYFYLGFFLLAGVSLKTRTTN